MPVHHINKVVLDFSFPGGEKDTALQETKQLFNDKIMPELNEGFNNISGNIYISSLAIDIGETSPELFAENFLKAFKSSFARYVTDAVSTAQDRPATAVHLTAEHVRFFLQKGYWQWNFQQKTEKEIFGELRVFLNTEPGATAVFSLLASENPYAAERLLNLVAGDIKTGKILLKALGKYHPALPGVFALMPAGWEQKAFNNRNFYFFFLRELLMAKPVTDIDQARLLVEKAIRLYDGGFTKAQAKSTAQPAFKTNNAAAFLKRFFASLEKGTGKEFIKAILQVDLPQTVKQKDAKKAGGKKIPLNEAQQTNTIAEDPYDTEEEKIHIGNAGLLLFHPFLQAVFTELNWLTGTKQFLNARTRQKAVLFLQYLLNGKSRQPEHQLVLNKILCNWPIHLPLPGNCYFTAREKSAAADLATSLRDHWTALRNTSVRGLIESFINRPGLLQKTTGGFLIQVERRSIDILLDALPFGITPIKLPWNEQIIYTEW